MYICICQAITDRQINKAIDAGIDSMDQLRDTLGVASCCGSCETDAEALIQASRSTEPSIYRPGVPASN